MPGKPQVTLTLAGDGTALERAFESVGQSSKKLADDVGASSKRIEKEAGDGFDRAGEAADQFDTRSMGARDGITGIQDTMTGFSSLAQGDYVNGLLNLGSGFSDIGSSLYNFVIPSLKSLSKATIMNAANLVKNTAATVASKAAQLAVSAATKAWAAAQWLINAALTANPIGLVIAAIALLALGIIYAYKHSDKFRAIVQGALNGVLSVAKAVGGWFVNTFWPWLKNVMDKVIGAFQAVVGWVRKNWSSLLSIITGPFSSAASAIWKHRDSILNAIRAVPGAISGFMKNVASIISAPFRAAFNGIRNAWNSTVGGKGFTVPGWIPSVGGKGFTIPYFHTGGIVSGAMGAETLAVLKAGERITAGSAQPAAAEQGPTYLEAHIEIGGEVVRVVQVEMKKRDRQLKRAVTAGAF